MTVLIDGIATAGAVAMLKGASKSALRHLLGEKQWRAVQRVLEGGLSDTLRGFEERLDPDVAAALRSLFSNYFADEQVANILVVAAITRQSPNEQQLKQRFRDLGFDEDTLPIGLGAFVSSFSVALRERIREEVSKPDSALSNFATHEKLDRLLDAVHSAALASPATRGSLDLSLLDEDDIRRYKEWLARVTSNFSMPGLGVALPINEAWIELRARENTVGELDAEHILHLNQLTVVVGKSGAGKSTLQRRWAHRLAVAGEKVLLGRLPMVLRAMERGQGFEEAVVKVAADGFGVEEATARCVLSEIDYLLADGLDECEPERQRVAEALQRWAEGHPEAKVVVMTRAEGHDPALLPGWGYAELLPLEESRIDEYARRLMESIPLGDGADIEERVNSFERSLEENKAAALAARNPLLLGFLIQLFVNGVGFGSSRAEVYRRIFDQIQEHPPYDRELMVEVDATVARHALEAMGWILQHHPELSRRELIEKLGDELASELGVTMLQGRREAEKCLRFWEERRVVERLTFGLEDVVRFVHLSLGEYAAGSFASKLDDEELRDWVRHVRRARLWRETVLYAAGEGAAERIARTLLELDDPEDVAAVETELALEVLAEAPKSSPALVREAADRLQDRLVTPVPLVAIAAAEAALGLAAQAPEIVGPVVRPLTNHAQEWTRFSAIRLTLACGGEWADLDAFEALVDEASGGAPSIGIPEDQKLGQRRGVFTWGFESEMLREGVEHLIQERPGEETDRRVEQVYLGKRISVGTHNRLTTLLLQHGGYEVLLEKALQRYKSSFANLAKWSRYDEATMDRDLAILEAVLRATELSQGVSLPEPSEELTSLSRLIYGMGWPKETPKQWVVMRDRYDLDAVDAVFRGAIAAMELDPVQVAAEAALAKKRFEEDEGSTGRLLDQLVELPVSPRWELALGADVPADDLVRALKHPSAPIVTNAVMLIEYGAGGSEVPELLKAVAESGTEYTYNAIAYLAPKIWGGEALEILLEILGNGPITLETHWLLTLPDLPGARDDERVYRALLRGLKVEDPYAATNVAEALADAETLELKALAPQLEEALEHWTRRGTWCDRDEIVVHGSSCPECHIVPPSPRAHLVRLLARLGRVGFEQLTELSSDLRSDVMDAATELLVDVASNSPRMLEDLLERVSREELSIQVLDQVLSLPSARLCAVKVALISLLDTPSAIVRERVLRAIAELGWIERDEAIALAEEALRDNALIVRDQAVRTIRAVRVA